MADPMNLTVFSLMKSRLQMLGQRQKVISENIANVSTPGFVPSDVDQDAFARTMERIAGGQAGAGKLELITSNAAHIKAPATGGSALMSLHKAPDSETTLDGNAVVVEEQMMKVAETRTEFETMVGLYQKSLGLLRMASRSPSR